MSNREEEVSVSEIDKKATTVSERKIEANRENAKRSTGPKTIRGKRNSSFNGLKHGLLSKRLMFNSAGKPVNGLHELLESLREEYGHGDVRVELVLEMVVADYWRQSRGLEHEIHCLGKGASAFHAQGMMSNIHRYVTGNRRALMKSLELLEKMRASSREGADTRDSSAGCSPAPESETPDEYEGQDSAAPNASSPESTTTTKDNGVDNAEERSECPVNY